MFAACASLLVTAVLFQHPSPPAPHSVAARINDDVITWDEVDLRLHSTRKEEVTPDLRRSELRQAVQERLFLQEAKRMNLSISETEVDGRIEMMKKQMGKPEDPKDLLERRFNDRLAFLHRTLAEFREQVRIEMLTQRLYGRLIMDSMNRPSLRSTLLTELVSPEEVRDYYNSHPDEFKAIFNITVGRIAMRFGTELEKEAKLRLADSLARKLEAKADFQALAIYYTELTTNGVPFFVYRELKPEASEFTTPTNTLIFHELAEGDVSKPVIDKNWINLFKLERRVDEKGETFEEAQARIRSTLENKKREENRRLLRDELLKTAYLEPADLFNNN